jgi:hypothetical protein
MSKFNFGFQSLYQIRNVTENRGRYAHIIGLILVILTSIISTMTETYSKEIWLTGVFLSGLAIAYGWKVIIQSKISNGTLNDIKVLLPYLKVSGLIALTLYVIALFRFLM